ncbi:transposase [Capnocytophaga canimorsus]|uniref:transposase n=1 Tax=Capnocytophaga canimorsus TaxID=28188 RepID=UPI00385DC3DB
MKNYPTDITDNQWQFIKKTLNFNERKRKHDLRTICNAIMYLVKTGIMDKMVAFF